MGDDLISRQVAIEAIRAEREWLDENIQDSQHHFHLMNETARILFLIGELPSVQQKQNLAYWIGNELGECSNCGHNGCSSDIWNGCLQMFCPNCGARMEERAEQVSERGGNG